MLRNLKQRNLFYNEKKLFAFICIWRIYIEYYQFLFNYKSLKTLKIDTMLRRQKHHMQIINKIIKIMLRLNFLFNLKIASNFWMVIFCIYSIVFNCPWMNYVITTPRHFRNQTQRLVDLSVHMHHRRYGN